MTNNLLIWVIGFINILTLFRTARSRHQRRWAWSSGLVLAALGASLALAPDVAGWIAGGAWAIVIVLPATAVRSLSRALLRQRYTRARRLTSALRWLVPFNSWDGQAAFIRALEVAQAGRFAEAEALFQELKKTDEQLARSADLQILRLHNRWDEALAMLTTEFRPQDEYLDPQTIVLLLRALGETGRPDELVSTYEHFRPVINSVALPYSLRKSCQLFAFAFCGRKEEVRWILEDALHDYPDEVKDFWLATADMTGGHRDRAIARFEGLQDESNPLNRRMVQQRLVRPLPVAETLLATESVHVLDRLWKELQEEARYEIRTGRSFRIAHATKILIAVNLLVFVVEILEGGSENIETLLRLGALTPDAVRAGEWWRLVAASFLHVGPVHLASNMLGLYILGPYVELSLGSMRFTFLYFLAGLGSMIYCFIDMVMENPQSALLVGASGSIMALVGAVGAVLVRGWRSERSRLARRKLHLILVIVLVQLTFDFLNRHVSIEAHLSGLVLGFLLALLLGQRVDGGTESRRETQRHVADPT